MIPHPSAERVQDLLRHMRGLPVLVVGDLMLDRFLWGNVSRISPEAPVPVVHLNSETARLGGAGNVARNLHALGGRTQLVGVVGNDVGGGQFRECLSAAGLDPAGLVEVPGRTTTIKTRVIAHHQQVVRIDREMDHPVPARAVETLAALVLSGLSAVRAVLISDYDKGVVCQDLLDRILPAAGRAGRIVAIDPKPSNYEHYRGATVLTPNAQEARSMAGLRGKSDPDLVEAGQTIRRHLGCPAVLVTQGERGMTLFREGEGPLRIPALAREVFDVTGAGDTVISTLTLALAAGASLEEASVLSNLAAGSVVGKLGTAEVTPEDLLLAVASQES